MRLPIDAPRHPAHDDEAGSGELPAERSSHRSAVGGARAGTDDRNGGPGQQLRGRRRRDPENGRRIVDRPQEPRKRRPLAGSAANGHAAPDPDGRTVGERLREVLRQHRLCSSQRGDRTCDTSDPCPAAAREQAPARQHDRAARRPPRCGRRTSPSRSRSRAAITRARTAADASPGGDASSSARGRGIATTRSKRSRSARETFSR